MEQSNSDTRSTADAESTADAQSTTDNTSAVEDSRSLGSMTETHVTAQSSTVLRGVESGVVNPLQPFGYTSTTRMRKYGSGSTSKMPTGSFEISVVRASKGDKHPLVTITSLGGFIEDNFAVSKDLLDKIDLTNMFMKILSSSIKYVVYALDIYHVGKSLWEDYKEEQGYDKTASVAAVILAGHLGGFIGAFLGIFIGSLLGGILGIVLKLEEGELLAILFGSFHGSIVGGIIGADVLGKILEVKLYELYEEHIRPRLEPTSETE